MREGSAAAARSGGPRLLLYSHDTAGIGNIRRTLLIAAALSRDLPDASTLILTGSPIVHGLALPEGVDYVKLPSLDRVRRDTYAARSLLHCTPEVKKARSNLLLAATRSFDPDLVIVDKRPTGIGGELLPALRFLRRRGRARLVLGIRDVLDERWVTRRQLARSRSFQTLEHRYDEIWIYGCASVFDAIKEYAFPEAVAGLTHFCGYLRYPVPLRGTGFGTPGVLVTVGGGQDGAEVVGAWLEALRSRDLPAGLHSRVVLGPQMPASARERLRGQTSDCAAVRFEDFSPDMGRLFAEADGVVCMAGYNTVCELLSAGVPAVLVPRIAPVEEQRIRARRLDELGLFRSIEPTELEPAALAEALLGEIARQRPRPDVIDLGGLDRVCARARHLLGEPAP